MVSGAAVELHAGSLRLVLLPALGGSIARLDRGSVALLRGSDAPAHPLESACFPLVPFCNRIRDGSFRFRDREVRLSRNMAGEKSPIHGQGWLSPWSVEESDNRTAELRFIHEPGEWPWRYEARQRFALDENGLSAELACRNLADEPMPCGLGFHPYFRCGEGTSLETSVTHVWTVDADVLPVARIPATERYDLSHGPACGRGLDNGFDGWSGGARIAMPLESLALRLSSPDASRFQLYSPADLPLFVAEPVTHANDALAAPEGEWSGLGIRILEPGEAMTLRMRIDVAALND